MKNNENANGLTESRSVVRGVWFWTVTPPNNAAPLEAANDSANSNRNTIEETK
jgi:hypothetical protein